MQHLQAVLHWEGGICGTILELQIIPRPAQHHDSMLGTAGLLECGRPADAAAKLLSAHNNETAHLICCSKNSSKRLNKATHCVKSPCACHGEELYVYSSCSWQFGLPVTCFAVKYMFTLSKTHAKPWRGLDISVSGTFSTLSMKAWMGGGCTEEGRAAAPRSVTVQKLEQHAMLFKDQRSPHPPVF